MEVASWRPLTPPTGDASLRAPLTTRPPTAPFVGRSREVARLREHLRAARDGDPRVVFIEGEAGIGKSRLIRNVQRLAHDAGMEILPARCTEELGLPYQPLRSAFLPRLGEFVRTSPGLADSVATLERFLDATDDDALAESATRSEHARFLHTVAQAMIALARTRPTLVTVDDLHWADDPSLDLLVQLVLEVSDISVHGGVPLLLLGTHRPDPSGRLGRDLARLRREEICDHIELGPLDELAAGQLLTALGLEHASHQLVKALLRASRGNPLLLESAAAQLSKGGVREEGGELVSTRSLEDLSVPAELSNTASARLADLDDEARDLLMVAAIVGDPFAPSDLAAVIGVTELEVTGALEVALAREILVREADTVAFANPMFTSVLRSSTPAARRREIHLAAARAMASSKALEPDRALTIGYHLAETGSTADAREVIAGCRAAGERAWQLAAWGQSASMFDAAVAASRRDIDPVDQVELLVRAGVAHCRNHDPGIGRARLSEAVDDFLARGETAGAVGALIELVHAEVSWGNFGRTVDVGLLESHLPEIEKTDVVLAARGYVQLAEALWPQFRISRAERHATHALDLLAQRDDASVRSRAHLARAQARWMNLDLHGALDALLTALDTANKSGDAWLAEFPLTRIALTLFWLGRLDEAESYARQARIHTERTANWSEQSLALAALTCVAVTRGEFEEAERHGEDALSAIRLSGYTWSAHIVFPALVTARLLQSDVLGARSALHQWTETVAAFDDASSADTVDLVDLLIDVHAEEADRVRATLGARPAWATGDAIAAIGGMQRVGAMVDAAEPDSIPNQWRASLETAMDRGMLMTEGLVMLLPRVLADLLARKGQVVEAVGAYRTAIDTAMRIGSRPELARAQLGYARLLRDREPEMAHDLATRAARLFGTLSMPVYEREAREVRAATGLDLGPAPEPLASSSPMSRRTLVLLFTDVVDSTRLTEELGDEVYLARAQDLDTRVRDAIGRNDGQPVEGIRPGDGLLAVFGTAEQAIRCAALAHEQAAAIGLQLHVGIHVGDVIRSRTGVHGAAVNLAARVCEMAPPGWTLTSAAVRSVAGPHSTATFEEFGVHDLKGIAEPQVLFVAHIEAHSAD